MIPDLSSAKKREEFIRQSEINKNIINSFTSILTSTQ